MVKTVSARSQGLGDEGTPKLALVLWHGDIGGAEIMNTTLAQRFRRLGVDASVVFVGHPGALESRLSSVGVPQTSLGFRRGRNVLRHPRSYAAGVSRAGPDGALLLQCGFMGAALRAGGYKGPIVAVEHGPLNKRPGFSRYRRAFRRLDRRSGAWADDAEVAVSDFVLDQMRRGPHAEHLLRIHNGIDPDAYRSSAAKPDAVPPNDGLVVGFMGRLVEGKGVDHLIRALAKARPLIRARLLIAGGGPERPRLASLANELGVSAEVSFAGVINDVQAFWQRCDIAVVPTAELEETFSMVTLEAMTCGKSIIATRSGAIPELLVDGTTGTLVARGDFGALAKALVAYAENPEMRYAHGDAARTQAIERFHIRDCAQAYLDLFARLREPLAPGLRSTDGEKR